VCIHGSENPSDVNSEAERSQFWSGAKSCLERSDIISGRSGGKALGERSDIISGGSGGQSHQKEHPAAFNGLHSMGLSMGLQIYCILLIVKYSSSSDTKYC
jgi:hypothetical protein